MATETEGGSYGGSPFDAMDPETARHPQPSYKMLRDLMPVMRMDGAGVVLSAPGPRSTRRSATRRCSRRTCRLSISGTCGRSSRCRSTRPTTRSTARSSTRCSRRGRWRCSRSRSPRLVNDLIDGFVDRGEIDFAAEFSMPFPSQVFLTLLGLPLDELPTFLKMKDGIIRPDHVVGQAARPPGHASRTRTATAQSIYDYFDEVLDEREAEPARRPRRAASSTPRSTATASPARTSSTSASCSSSPASTP